MGHFICKHNSIKYIHVIKLKYMKTFNGIISVLLGLGSLYLICTSKTDQDVILGFMVLLLSIIFMLFMLMEERNEEISGLRRTILQLKGII
jgi:hypothetical protein